MGGGDRSASRMEIRMSGFLPTKKGYQSNNGGFQLIFHLNMQKVKISKCGAMFYAHMKPTFDRGAKIVYRETLQT